MGFPIIILVLPWSILLKLSCAVLVKMEKDRMEGRPVTMVKRLTVGLGTDQNAGSLALGGWEVQAVGSTKTENIIAKG